MGILKRIYAGISNSGRQFCIKIIDSYNRIRIALLFFICSIMFTSLTGCGYNIVNKSIMDKFGDEKLREGIQIGKEVGKNEGEVLGYERCLKEKREDR